LLSGPWFSKDLIGQPFDSAQPAQNDGRLGGWREDTIKLLTNGLRFKNFTFESPKPFDQFEDLPGLDSAVQTKMASIFYSMWYANELMAGRTYDLVIRTRLDLLYSKPVIIKDLIGDKIEDTIYCPVMYQ